MSLGVTYPSGAVQKELLLQVYSEAKVNPGDVSYIEAHGTGTKAGDPEEANAITDVFCASRTADNPLLIGSVKSNMGHPEPASGLAGVTKVLLAMQHGVLPGNLHYKKPNPDIPALIDGRLKVEWRHGFCQHSNITMCTLSDTSVVFIFHQKYHYVISGCH